MRIAVLSDIHDRIDHLQALLPQVQRWRPQAMILCGDITRPQTLEACVLPAVPLHFCLGNCDREQAEGLRHAALTLPARAFGELGQLALPNGASLAFSHFPAVARRAAIEGGHQAVFFGHTHKAHQERIGARGTLLANPGDVEGRYGRVSALFYDSDKDTVDWIEA